MTKTHIITYRVLLVLLSIMFLFSGLTKVFGSGEAAAGFQMVGLPMWFMYVIGIGEIAGAVGLWLRPTFRYAYEGLFLVLIGAFGTSVATMQYGASLFPLIIAGVLGYVVRLHHQRA